MVFEKSVNVLTCTMVKLWILLLLAWIKMGSPMEIDNQLMTQDGHFIDNTIQGSEPEIPLESFFWTGSGDGPPPLQPPKPIPTLNRDVFIKTSTVLATVYIDGQSPMDNDPLCVYNCDDTTKRAEDQQLQNSTISYTRSDRRFWLLTVVAGFFSTADVPLIEEHLAKLYRIAFARQQAQHLGISSESISLNNISLHPINVNKISSRRRRSNSYDIQPTRTVFDDSEQKVNATKKNSLGYSTQRRPLVNNAVRVIIHNLTLLTEDDILQRNMDHQVDLIHSQSPGSNNNSQITNQTEFLYTVFVGNRPILAVTAADDMKLVSDAEVVKAIGSQVVTKSEPYLKEPLATPLIPATVKQESNIFYYAMENPFMFGILCATLILLVFLLVGFLFMAKSKRQHSAEIRRLAAREHIDPEKRPIHKLPTGDLKSGTDNVAFDGDRTDGEENRDKFQKRKSPPDIEFPLPPLHRPSSSSSGTSDSSVYYNKRYRDEAKNIVKAHNKGDINYYKKRHPGETDGDEADGIYAIVAKEKHKKSKKRYIAGNRVGSVEHTKAIVEVISSPSHGTSDVTYAAPDNYEQMDTFNLREAARVHERRNKQLKQALFGNSVDDFEIASSVINSPNEAINRELFKALKKSSYQNSADSESIGSFLSMASIRSFPKCAVPEPLSRVLEPVTITHYDQSDFDDRKIYKPSTSGAYKKQVIDQFVHNDKRISRQTQDGQFIRTQSDGSDPGVVGPIVWEMHKKEVGKQNSPLKDPAKTRNRFEGLLEGAISLYETNDKDELGNSRKQNMSLATRPPDVRGKSAIISTGRPRMGILRPITAMTTAHNDGVSSPPTPSKAWSSAAPSPLVRPLSAGPFHRPPDVDPTRLLTPHTESVQLSTAPLIEAIQKELKKFNRNSHPT